MFRLCILAASLLASASAAAQWAYRTTDDQMGRGKVKYATATSTNVVNFSFPYGAQRAKLMLRTHPEHGKDVMLDLEKGQFLCRQDDCEVLVRFDDREPEKFAGAGPADLSTDTLFIRDYERFLNGLKDAKRIRIQASFYQDGNRVFDFNVRGLKWEGVPPAAVSSTPRKPTPAQVKEEQRKVAGCLREANDKGLDGEERKSFLAACL